MATLLNREQILAVQDTKYEDLPVPEWGGTVRIRMLSGYERDKFEESNFVQKRGKQVLSLENIRARLVSLCVVGEDGKRVFSDLDVMALGRKSSAALDRVFEAAKKLNRFSEDDIEEMVGNSQSGPSGATT